MPWNALGKRCAARIGRFGIASVSAVLELRRAFPAPEDRGVFADMNYAASAIEIRKRGILRDCRPTRRPNPPHGARPSEPSDLARAPSVLIFSFHNMQGLT